MQNARFILRSSSFSLRRGKRTTMAMLNKKALHIGIKQLCWYLCITPQASLSHRKLHNSCRQPHYAVVNVSTQGEPHAAGPARSWDKSITSGLTPSGVGSNRSAQIVTRRHFLWKWTSIFGGFCASAAFYYGLSQICISNCYKYNNWCKASKLIAPALTTIWSQFFKMGSWKKQQCIITCYWCFTAFMIIISISNLI